MRPDFDLVVLGGGTGGLVSSLIAAGVGARVALVERAKTGGDCLWTGCVPSKSLISAARLAHRMRHADAVGLPAVDPRVDFGQVMAHIHRSIRTIEPHDSPDRLRAEGVEVIDGEGRFVDSHTVTVAGRRLTFRAAIVATGSEPQTMPSVAAGGALVLTTDSFWSLTRLPRRLAVLGGGPIGCELAQAMRRLGSEVTLVELAERLLLKEEEEASALVRARLEAEGVDVRVATKAVEVQRGGDDGAGLVVERPTEAGRRSTSTGCWSRPAACRARPASASRRPASKRTRDARWPSPSACRPARRTSTRSATSRAVLPSRTSRRTTRAWRPSTRCSAPGGPSTRRSRG